MEDVGREMWETEQWEREQLESMRAVIVEELGAGRLHDQLLAKPDLPLIARTLIEEAASLLGTSDRGALVLAFSAVEVTTKTLILRPIIEGAVHNAAAARIVQAVADRLSMRDWLNLLSILMKEASVIDLTKAKRSGGQMSTLEEIEAIGVVRNTVVHRGASATRRQAEDAIHLARHLIDEVYAGLLSKFHLAIDADGLIAVSV